MINQSDVSVRLDDRIRLMSALLAATDWPDKSQERKPHGTHAHARATRKMLSAFKTHEAVQVLQGMLDQNAPLEAMYTLITRLSWPDLEADGLPRWVPQRWPALIHDFYQKTELAAWWKKEDFAWQKSQTEAGKMFEKVNFRPFLKPFLGEIHESLVFAPNISYPSDQEVGIRWGRELVCIAPPRLAWGDSPPWPFDEDPVHIYRAALGQFARLLMLTYLRANAERVAEAAQTPLPVGDQFQIAYPTWEEQFSNLFVSGAVAIYLEDHVSQAEANAFVLMERKAHGMSMLPGVVSVLRRYMSELEAGRYKDLLDFLPVFPRQLRVAKRIVSL
jgi:hypothetical protein